MKIIYFSKTIAAYDLKARSYTELNDLMKLHEYQRSRSFHYLTFHKDHYFLNLNFVFLKKLLYYLKPNHMKASGSSERKNYITGLGHMTKMAATPICSKRL